MKILTRYILREHVGPFFFALSALTALLLLNQVAKQFGNLVGKGLSWGVIGEFFFLSIPFIIAMTLPMAVLVAVLYAFSRLAAENEVTAMRASGVSVHRLVRPVLGAATLLALLMLAFNDQVLPRSNHRLRTLQTDIARKKPTFALREQVINELSPGKLFLRTGHIDETSNRMREVQIYNFDDPARRKTIFADSGRMGLTPDGKDLQMTLHHGYLQTIPGNNLAELQRLYFTSNLVRVRGVANQLERTENDTYKSEREMSICEMESNLEQGVNQFQSAKSELADALGNAARLAATGRVETRRTRRPPAKRTTSGQVYCQIATTIFGGPTPVEAAQQAPSDTSEVSPPGAPADDEIPGEEQERLPQVQATPLPATQIPAPQTATPQTPAPRQPKRSTPAPPPTPRAGAAQQPTRRPSVPRWPTPETVRPPSAGGQRPLGSPAPGPRLPDMRAGQQSPGAQRPGAPPPGGSQAGPQPRAAPMRSPSAGGTAAAFPPNLTDMHPDVGPGTTLRPGALQSVAQIDVLRARIFDARTIMNRFAVEIQKKFALAAACVVFVLLGAPIALMFPRGGVGLVLGVSLIVFALYYVGLIAGETLSDKLILNPFWAMWMANILFTVIGVALLFRVQRTASSARAGGLGEIWESMRASIARRRPRLGVLGGRRRRPV